MKSSAQVGPGRRLSVAPSTKNIVHEFLSKIEVSTSQSSNISFEVQISGGYWGPQEHEPPWGSKFFHAVFGHKDRLTHPLWELAPPRKILDPPMQMVDINYTKENFQFMLIVLT